MLGSSVQSYPGMAVKCKYRTLRVRKALQSTFYLFLLLRYSQTSYILNDQQSLPQLEILATDPICTVDHASNHLYVDLGNLMTKPLRLRLNAEMPQDQ